MRATVLSIILFCGLAAAEPLRQVVVYPPPGETGYAHFRIPGLVVTKRGSLLAYAEARRNSTSDWGSIDIVMRRSTDRGRSWSPMQLLAGPQSIAGRLEKNPVAQKLAKPDEITFNNPVAIVDRKGRAIHFLFCIEYMRAFYMRSDDDGKTFSRPVEITQAFGEFRPGYPWRVIATGPGHGIQLKNGRLVVPVWLALGEGGNAHAPSVAATIYSDDAGATWHAGEIAAPHAGELISPNETAAVQLADGRVMLNVRSPSLAHRRLIVTSADGATGWSQPRFDPQLLEPICFGSLIKTSGRKLVFANPDTLERTGGPAAPGKSRDRKQLTIQWSGDDGTTWAHKRVLEPSWSAYSDLAAGKGGAIYCLYERGSQEDKGFRPRSITLAVFDEAWVKGK